MVCSRVLVEIAYDLPWIDIPVRARSSSPSPFTFPLALALTTEPATGEDAGMATLPPTLTGLTRVAVKLWPVWLVFEPSACPVRTVMVVPAGTTMGGGGAGGGAAAAPGCADPLASVAGAPGADEGAGEAAFGLLLEGAAAGPAGCCAVCEFGFEERQPDKQARLSIAISPRARRIGAPFTQQVF